MAPWFIGSLPTSIFWKPCHKKTPRLLTTWKEAINHQAGEIQQYMIHHRRIHPSNSLLWDNTPIEINSRRLPGSPEYIPLLSALLPWRLYFQRHTIYIITPKCCVPNHEISVPWRTHHLTLQQAWLEIIHYPLFSTPAQLNVTITASVYNNRPTIDACIIIIIN